MTQRMLWDVSKDLGSDCTLVWFLEESFLLGRDRGGLLLRSRTKNLKLWHILVTPGLKFHTLCLFLVDSYFSGKKEPSRIAPGQEIEIDNPLIC